MIDQPFNHKNAILVSLQQDDLMIIVRFSIIMPLSTYIRALSQPLLIDIGTCPTISHGLRSSK